MFILIMGNFCCLPPAVFPFAVVGSIRLNGFIKRPELLRERLKIDVPMKIVLVMSFSCT